MLCPALVQWIPGAAPTVNALGAVTLLFGLQLRYTLLFYGPLLLHTTLIYRMYGNVVVDLSARQRGGVLNATAILLFLALMALTLLWSNRRQKEAGRLAARFMTR